MLAWLKWIMLSWALRTSCLYSRPWPAQKPIGNPLFGGHQEKTMGHGPWAMANNVSPNLDQRMTHRHFLN